MSQTGRRVPSGEWRSAGRHLDDEMTDLGLDPHQVAGHDAEAQRVGRMEPERIRLGDLVEPFRIGAAGVDMDRQAKGRDQRHLPGLESARMDMAQDVAW